MFLISQVVEPIVNVTPNFSPWQMVATIMGVLGGVFFVADYFRKQFFKAWTDWKISQLESEATIAKKAEELKAQVAELSQQVEQMHRCIHDIPGHPENKQAV